MTTIIICSIVVFVGYHAYLWLKERHRRYWDGYTLVGWKKHSVVDHELHFKNGVVIRDRRYLSGQYMDTLSPLWGHVDALEQQIDWGKLDHLRIKPDEEPREEHTP